MQPGRTNRSQRLKTSLGGAWSTASQDYVFLATQLFALSSHEATPKNRYSSLYVFAGLPMLFAALRALLIECNSGVFGSVRDESALARLANEPNEQRLLEETYQLEGDLLVKLNLLYEARNEIVHPAHRPTGTSDNTPEYMRPLKELGVLVSTADPDLDYVWITQLQSHKLFRFAFETIEVVVAQVLAWHDARDPGFRCQNLASYGRFREREAAS